METLFRVQKDASKQWTFLCQICCEQSQANPHYKYGGTWKARK
jgi:hypothetical protein